MCRFIQKCPPPASFAEVYKESFLAMAGALLMGEKIATELHYFGLDCGMLEFFKYSSHEPSSKEKLLTFLHSWSPVWREDCGLCPYNPSAEEVGGLDRFLYEAAQKFEVFSNIQD